MSDTPNLASAALGLRQVFLRDLVLHANIGIYAHERRGPQRVRINIDLAVVDDGAAADAPDGGVGRDDLSRVVDYERLTTNVRTIIDAGHVKLVETLAERIAKSCLTDKRVRSVIIRVEKLDIFADAMSAGVQIERRQTAASAELSTPDPPGKHLTGI
jgi:dihydroneopterin aldolase